MSARARVAALLLALLAGAAGCARVHPHLSLPQLTLGEPSFFPTLEAYAESPIVGGNSVELIGRRGDVELIVRR